MRRRSFCQGALAVVTVPPSGPKRQPKFCATWDTDDGEAFKVSLKYDDGTTVITTIPYRWLYDKPIENRMLFYTNPTKHDWVAICERIVEEYTHGR
jgi:hypothetical protein